MQKKMSTEITKTNDLKLAPSLNVREQRIVKAAHSLRCIDLIHQKKSDVVKELTAALNRMQAVAGFRKITEAETDLQAKIINAMVDIIKRFKWLRIDELRFLLHEGMIGEYGEFHSLDARTLNSWIKSYNEKERQKSLKKQQEFSNQQASLEEESRKKKEHEQAMKALRESFIATYEWLQIEYSEAIDAGTLVYSDIPRDVDAYNALFYAFKKNWHNTLGFDVKILNEILEEERAREVGRISQSGDWVKLKNEEAVMAGAKSNARSRLFRMRLAIMLMAGEDIEEFIRENNI